MKPKLKDFIFINIGVLITAFALHLFLIPANLAVGGVTGLAMVINHIVSFIPIGVFMIFTNIILFIVGFALIGRAFGFKTIYASFFLSFAISFLEKFFPLKAPLTEDIFLNLVVGILIQGVGMGILFYENASTGGTDIVAKIINKFFHVPVGIALFFTDFLITLAAGLSFGITLGLYALIGILLNAIVIDRAIEGFGLKLNVKIVSEQAAEIENFILSTLNRSATRYSGKGVFSKEDKTVIETILTKKEYHTLKKYLSQRDDGAFVSTHNVHEVIGKGFSNGSKTT